LLGKRRHSPHGYRETKNNREPIVCKRSKFPS